MANSTALTTRAKQSLLNTPARLKALLLAVLGPADRSMLPFMPRPVKLLVALLFLLNWRSWPFVWHWKVWKPVIDIRWSALFKTKTVADRKRWLATVSCVNGDPFELVSVTKCYASIDDCDYNMHLSNSCYAKSVDSARMRAAVQVFAPIFGDGVWMALGGAQYQFIREIPFGTEYEIRTTIGGWEDKWMFLVHHYVSYPSSKSKTAKAGTTLKDKTPHISVMPNIDGVVSESTSGTQTPARAPRPAYKAPGTVPAARVRKPLPENAVVHCVAVSLYCFKIGRITVPPKIAFVAAGFGDPSRRRWMRVQEKRFAPLPKGEKKKGKDAVKNYMTDMLKGGWKTDDEAPEGFWELPEYEERRLESMEDMWGSFQDTLKALKEKEP